MRTASSNDAGSGCYPEVFLSLLRQMVTMDTLAALDCSSCATGAGPASCVEAPARLVAQHQNLAKKRTVLALLSHGYLQHSATSDEKLLETSRGLWTGGPPRRAIAATSAREGEKARNTWHAVHNSVKKVVRNSF